MYEDFRNFYNDALPEFSKAGKVVQFKVTILHTVCRIFKSEDVSYYQVSRNYEVHLRGNVYVQYLT